MITDRRWRASAICRTDLISHPYSAVWIFLI